MSNRWFAHDGPRSGSLRQRQTRCHALPRSSQLILLLGLPPFLGFGK